MAIVSIAATQLANWQGNSSGVALRIYANQSFTASDGTLVQRSRLENPASLGTFFFAVACTVQSGELIVPAVQIEPTTDSTDHPDATYSAVLWDSTSGKPIQRFGSADSFAVAPGVTTWSQIFAAAADLQGE